MARAEETAEIGVERAERNLRERILLGALPQGHRLSEVRLAKEYGLSRGPVREALRRLERERLVTAVPNRGTFVTRITETTVVEVLEMRALLEPFAFEQAISPRFDALAVGLQGVLNEMAARRDKGDYAAFAGLHGRFHACFYELARNDALLSSWRLLEAPLELHVLSRVKSDEDAEAMLASHTELTEALMQRSVADGRELLLGHVREAAKALDVPFLPHAAHALGGPQDIDEQGEGGRA